MLLLEEHAIGTWTTYNWKFVFDIGIKPTKLSLYTIDFTFKSATCRQVLLLLGHHYYSFALLSSSILVRNLIIAQLEDIKWQSLMVMMINVWYHCFLTDVINCIDSRRQGFVLRKGWGYSEKELGNLMIPFFLYIYIFLQILVLLV